MHVHKKTWDTLGYHGRNPGLLFFNVIAVLSSGRNYYLMPHCSANVSLQVNVASDDLA